MQERLPGCRKLEQCTTPWTEDDCRDAGGRATQGAVAELEPRLEQRSRSNCRDAQKRPTILLHFLHCTCDLPGSRKVEQRRSSCRDVQVPRSTRLHGRRTTAGMQEVEQRRERLPR
ncbi:MAG: hypothetical protein E2O38_09490 [Proteobacteria bacterium]|nr:MAG: hypothetical protein E2O38_09490 [Pseudomonadota bacterium]